MDKRNRINRLFTVLLHILFWALLLIMPFMFERGEPRALPPNMPPPPNFKFENVRLGIYVFQFLLIAYFYFVAFWLVPRFLDKKKGWVFAVLAISAGVFNLLVIYGVRSAFLSNHPPLFIRIEITLSIIILLSGITFGLIKRSFANDKKMNEIEAENLRTELLFLRSQISPHFLLNTLNNLVSLARKNSENLEPMLLKLSGILKYMVYEAEDDKIRLLDEINYLQNYISLQQLRTDKYTDIVFNCSVQNEDQMIVPMLLIPFIENAFKHGIVNLQKPYIAINLREESEQLVLSVVNKFDMLGHQVQDNTSGIGLVNVKRRLELLYPGNYELNIYENKVGLYSVNLKINLR